MFLNNQRNEDEAKYLFLNYQRNEDFVPQLSKERRWSEVFVPQLPVSRTKTKRSIRSSTIIDLTLLARPFSFCKNHSINKLREKRRLRSRVSSKQTKINFGSNRNKPKQDLFRVCFGLFRETNKKKFRFVSMFRTYIETTETNRNKLKQPWFFGKFSKYTLF